MEQQFYAFMASIKERQLSGSTGNTVVHRYVRDKMGFSVWEFGIGQYMHVSREGDWFILDVIEP